jgi:hypothetical protein
MNRAGPNRRLLAAVQWIGVAAILLRSTVQPFTELIPGGVAITQDGRSFPTLGAAAVPALSAGQALETLELGFRGNMGPLAVSLFLMVFLWLAATGWFGLGRPARSDWPVLLPFVFALGLRELYASHGLENNELHFIWNEAFDRHSVLYTFYVAFIQSLPGDGFEWVTHANGVVGAIAAIPLYLFCERRTGSQIVALAVSLLYAAHPILIQMAASDAPYSLCFATWFLGLLLLSGPEIGARELVGAGGLLGIAATTRGEGVLYLLASVCVLDVARLWRAAWKHRLAALAGLAVVLALVAVEVKFIYPNHIGSGHFPVDDFSIAAVLQAGLWSTDFNDRAVALLVLLGALAGVLDRRYRLGLGAAVAAVVVVWPFCRTTYGSYVMLHRLSPACAMHVIAAGVGAAYLTSGMRDRLARPWIRIAPATLVALSLVLGHRHQIHDPNALVEEFSMLRRNLAPRGVVNRECRLVWVGRARDTDLHNFDQVLPGMRGIQCQQSDCLAEVKGDGCFYYMRGLNCFSWDGHLPPACLETGSTPSGAYFDCILPECRRVERSLKLSKVEERTVDVRTAWDIRKEDASYPFLAKLGLYRIDGLAPTAAVTSTNAVR